MDKTEERDPASGMTGLEDIDPNHRTPCGSENHRCNEQDERARMRPAIFIPVSLVVGIAIGLALPRPHRETDRAVTAATGVSTAPDENAALDRASPPRSPANTSAATASTARSMATGTAAGDTRPAQPGAPASANTDGSPLSAASIAVTAGDAPTDIAESVLLDGGGTLIASDRSDVVLGDDRNFAKLLESMTLSATGSTFEKQKRYADSLQSDPLYASGSITIDGLQCGQKLCALAISSADPRDLEVFIERLGESKSAPVYAVTSVELAGKSLGKQARRVLISIDPKLRGIALPQGMSLPVERHTRP